MASATRGLLGLLTALVGLVGLVLVFELGTWMLRIHFPALRPSDEAHWAYHPLMGWFPRRHVSVRVDMGGPDAGQARINALGLRGPEIDRIKSRKKRLLVFGDSFIFGVGVDEEHLFTSHLSRHLERAAPGAYEIVNMGVVGYSTDQELILYESLGCRLAPDIVVLVMCDNDFEANTQDFVYGHYYKPYFDSDESRRLRRLNTPVPRLDSGQNVKLWLGQHSNLWNFLRTRRAPRPAFQHLLDFFQVAVPHRTPTDPVDLTEALVLAFRSAVVAGGGRFVVFNTGHRDEYTPWFRTLRPRLTAAGIEHLGLEGVLSEARRRKPERSWDFVRNHDTHWNLESHQLAAQIAYAHMRHLGWIP